MQKVSKLISLDKFQQFIFGWNFLLFFIKRLCFTTWNFYFMAHVDFCVKKVITTMLRYVYLCHNSLFISATKKKIWSYMEILVSALKNFLPMKRKWPQDWPISSVLSYRYPQSWFIIYYSKFNYLLIIYFSFCIYYFKL